MNKWRDLRGATADPGPSGKLAFRVTAPSGGHIRNGRLEGI